MFRALTVCRTAVISMIGICSMPALAAPMLYVSNSESKDISVFRLDPASGGLSAVQTLPVGGTVMPMALSPDRRQLYATLRSKPFGVQVLDIDPASGMLSLRGSGPLPDSMANISLDRSGKFLFAASYGGNKISISPLDANGIPAEASQIIPTPPMAHQITATTGNDVVYASSLGGDQLLSFAFDARTGTLTADPEPALQLPPKSGPRHFIFSADQRFVYLIDELDARLHVLRREAGTSKLQQVQTLSVLPPDFAGTPAAADIHLTPDGAFLYTSERGSNTLAGFKVDRASGQLTLIGHWPTETQPRGFNVSPDGRFLFAVGQKSHRLSAYRIDPKSGQLSLLAQYPTGQNPNWIEVVELP